MAFRTSRSQTAVRNPSTLSIAHRYGPGTKREPRSRSANAAVTPITKPEPQAEIEIFGAGIIDTGITERNITEDPLKLRTTVVYRRPLDFESEKRELSFSFKNYGPYLSDLKDTTKVSKAFDEMWRNGFITSIGNEPAIWYTEFLEILLEENRDYFQSQKKISHSDGKEYNFYEEAYRFSQNFNYSDEERRIFLSMAIELALRGTNVVEALVQLNKSKDEGVKKGFLNEIMAGWYLEKFVFSPSETNENDLHHSILFESFDRRDMTGHIDGNPKTREVDFVKEGQAIVSVKCLSGSFRTEARKLFYILHDNIDNPYLKDIRRMILIKTSENPQEFLPGYDPSSKIDTVLQNASRLIGPPGRGLKVENFSIYYLPELKNKEHISWWINKNYRAKDFPESFATRKA